MVESPDDPWAAELRDRFPAVYRALERSIGRVRISEMPERYRIAAEGYERTGLVTERGPLAYWIMFNPARSPDQLWRALPHEPIHALYGVKHRAQGMERPMQPPGQYAERIADRLDPELKATLVAGGITEPQELAVWAMAETVVQHAPWNMAKRRSG